MKKLPAPKKRPSEYAAPAAFGALTTLLIAFGVDPAKAAAISGAVAAVTPALITYAREKGWL